MLKEQVDFVMPENYTWEKLTATYGKFVVYPLERGYATTLGNALRRVLLSSIPGCAITEVKIEGALHEFSTLPGVVEDVPQILNNLKHVIVKLNTPGPEKLTLEVEEEGEVRANDLKGSENVEVLNPHLHIATLSKGGKLKMELTVKWGKGFEPAERRIEEKPPVGIIPLDAIFSPIKKVNFTMENVRVGKLTDYEKLIMEVWTDGTVTPQNAVEQASRILIEHFNFLLTPGVRPKKEPKETPSSSSVSEEILTRSVDEFDLSERVINALKAADVTTIGKLIQCSEKELLGNKNFGKKSLEEVKNLLSSLGLSLKGKGK